MRSSAEEGRARTSMAMALVLVSLSLCGGVSAQDSPLASSPDYRIAAEDVLQISVWKEPDLDKQVIVRPDGGISFPLAGNVPVAGLTPAAAEGEIANRLQRYIPDAVVTVSVVELKGMRIYVSGKVRSPGQFTVGRYVDVLQAITLAGGLTPYADENGIKVLRRSNGKETVYAFDYGEVRRGKNLQQNIVLQTDDVVVVP